MKLAAMAILMVAMVPTGATVSFDAESVRVGDAAVTDSVIQLKETPAGMLLVSKGSVEPLATPVSVSLASDHTLVLEPGVRVTRVADGFALSVHNRRRVELEVAGVKTSVVMPVTIEVTEAGWKVAGKEMASKTMTARRQDDDVDKNLGNLGDSAKRILTSNPRNAPRTSGSQAANQGGNNDDYRRRRKAVPGVYSNLIFTTSEAFSSNTIQGLLHASPSGF